MTCAVLFLLSWDYHKFRNIFPFNHSDSKSVLPQKNELTKKFPIKFFAGVLVAIALVVFHTRIFYTIMPRNTLKDCQTQCNGEDDIDCYDFCNCIHNEGKSLEKCLAEFKRNPD